MSPEQARVDADRIGPASDIYSLGAILYRIFTGRPPVEKDHIDVMLERARKGDFPGPRQVRKDVPPALEAICLKAMAAAPKGRYSSARTLAHDLELWLAGEPVSAYREPLADRTRRWLRGHRTAVTGTVASMAFAILGLGALAYERNQANKVLTVANTHATARYELARDAIRSLHKGATEELLLKQPGFDKLRAQAPGFSPRELQEASGQPRYPPRG